MHDHESQTGVCFEVNVPRITKNGTVCILHYYTPRRHFVYRSAKCKNEPFASKPAAIMNKLC